MKKIARAAAVLLCLAVLTAGLAILPACGKDNGGIAPPSNEVPPSDVVVVPQPLPLGVEIKVRAASNTSLPFTFVPQFSGNYTFSAKSQCDVSLKLSGGGLKISGEVKEGTKDVYIKDAALKKGAEYRIEMRQNSDQETDDCFLKAELTPQVLTYGDNPVALQSGEETIFILEKDAETRNFFLTTMGLRADYLDAGFISQNYSLIESDKAAFLLDGDKTAYVKFTNETAGAIAGVVRLSEGQRAGMGASAVKVKDTVFVKFTAPCSAVYNFDASGVTASVGGVMKTGQGYALCGGKTYFIKLEGAAVVSEVDLTVSYYAKNLHYGSVSIGVNGTIEKFMVSVTPKASGVHNLSLGEGFSFNLRMDNGAVLSGPVYSGYLNAGKMYVFQVSNDGSAVLNANVSIAHQTGNLGNNAVSFNDHNEAFLKIFMPETTEYSFEKSEGISNLEFYDSDFNSLAKGNDLFFETGSYYVKATGKGAGTLTVKMEGERFDVLSNTLTKGKRIFKFIPQGNKTYLFETFGDLNLNVHTSVRVSTQSGETLALSPSGKYVSVSFSPASSDPLTVTIDSDSKFSYGFRILYASPADAQEGEMPVLSADDTAVGDLSNLPMYVKLNVTSGNYNFYVKKFPDKKVYVKLLQNGVLTELTDVSGDSDFMKFKINASLTPNPVLVLETADGEKTNVALSLVKDYQSLKVVATLDGNIVSKFVKGYSYEFRLLTDSGFLPHHFPFVEYEIYNNGVNITGDDRYDFTDRNGKVSATAFFFDYSIDLTEYDIAPAG